VALAARGVEPVGMGRDVALQGVGPETGVTRRGFERAGGHPPRFIEPAEQQTGASQRVVGRANSPDVSPRRLTLEEPLALAEPVQRSSCGASSPHTP